MNAYLVSFNLDKFNCRCKHRHEIAKWGKVGKQYWILSSSHISTHPRVQKVNARFYIQRIPFFFLFQWTNENCSEKIQIFAVWNFVILHWIWNQISAVGDKKTAGTKRGKFNAASHVCFVEAVCDWFKQSGVRLFPLITKQTWYFVVDEWWNELTQTQRLHSIFFLWFYSKYKRFQRTNDWNDKSLKYKN